MKSIETFKRTKSQFTFIKHIYHENQTILIFTLAIAQNRQNY